MISVIIPMYNAETTVIDSIESVIKQTYEGMIEIIIVNDGSIDNSSHTVQEFVKNNHFDNRIIHLYNKENGGVSTARNFAIRKAKGNYIAFLDSDDIWVNNKLEKQINIIQNNEKIQFIGSNRNNEIYPFFGKKYKKIFCLSQKELFFKWYPQTSTAVVRKSLLDKIGVYNEEMTHAEDDELWTRIASYCDLFVLNENLVFTGHGKKNFGESGLSANLPEMYKGELFVLNDVRRKKEINIIEFCFFYGWLSMKYLRRRLLTLKN